MTNTYLFQGNPKYYDMDAYLATHPYIYWRCPNYKDKIQIGDRAILWRAGKDAGMIAIGKIVEAPTPASNIEFPEFLGQRFWTSDEMDANDIKAGIAISEVRLTGGEYAASRESFKSDSVVSKHRIITNPTRTVFQVEDIIASAMFAAWNNGSDSDEDIEKPESSKDMDSEGRSRYMLHKRRERSSALRKAKVKNFLTTNDFIHCELCNINLDELYPSSLSDGYIEVHHIKPISTLTEHTPTHLDDLILLCPNCHRMIHRTKNAENNLEELKKWFAK